MASAGSGGLLDYDRLTDRLQSRRLPEALYRDTLTIYGASRSGGNTRRPERVEGPPEAVHVRRELASRNLCTTHCGEIFFARRWMLWRDKQVYLIVHAFAKAIGYDLDEHGVAVIDAMNNGHPPRSQPQPARCQSWLAVFDGDNASARGYVQQIMDRQFDPQFVAQRCHLS